MKSIIIHGLIVGWCVSAIVQEFRKLGKQENATT